MTEDWKQCNSKFSINNTNNFTTKSTIKPFIKWLILWCLLTAIILIWIKNGELVNKNTSDIPNFSWLYTDFNISSHNSSTEEQFMNAEIINGIRYNEDDDLKDITFVTYPKKVNWIQPILFTANSNPNKEVFEYIRDFGDQYTNTSQFVSKVEHQYREKWIYSVKLKVIYNDGSFSTYQDNIYVWEIDYPIAVYEVKDSKWYYLQPNDVCRIKTETWVKEEYAYPVDRYAKFNINPSMSVNTKWNSNWLSYTFSVDNNLIKRTNERNGSFIQTWCHYIDLTVYDNNVWKDDEVRMRFNVKNALPSIKNVTLTFPEYSDNNMFTSESNQSKNITAFDCSWSNNLTIKVTAIDATDSDGIISRLRFYYYNTDNPNRILEYKDTWINVPYVYFNIPRMWWEYKFWVIIYDNDGWMIDSNDYLASNPTIYFPASCYNSDIPTATLKVNSQNIQVWDSVTYTIESKISNNNKDFETDRIFYYDFTWDGIWDLTSKQDTATYTFTEDYEDWVVPRAAVEYQRKLGITDWARIYVNKN